MADGHFQGKKSCVRSPGNAATEKRSNAAVEFSRLRPYRRQRHNRIPAVDRDRNDQRNLTGVIVDKDKGLHKTAVKNGLLSPFV